LATLKDIAFTSGGYDANGNIRDVVDRALSTCGSLDKELDKIDGSAIALEYFERVSPQTSYSTIEWLLIYVHTVTEGMPLARNRDEDVQKLLTYGAEMFDYFTVKLRSESLKQGLEALIKEQDHYRDSFMDIATVAIFFSSITATTLQFSYISANTTLSSTIVNICWFASLVLSIASATNSFLGAIVHQSPNYSPRSDSFRHRVLQTWFGASPPTLLTISGILFLMGICSFTFSSAGTSPSQGLLIKIVTIVLTSTNFLALLIMFLLAFTRLFDVAHQLAILVFLPPIIFPYLIHKNYFSFHGFSPAFRSQYASDHIRGLSFSKLPHELPILLKLSFVFIHHWDRPMKSVLDSESSPLAEIRTTSSASDYM